MNRPFLAFVHMERAGGTTLHHLLEAAMPGYLTVHPWYYWANEPEHCLGERELAHLLRLAPWVRGVGGHTVRAWLDYERVVGRPVQYMTFLRDPVQRYASHLRYQRQRMGIAWTEDAFLAEPRFSNFQTVRLVGRPDADAAIDLLESRFSMVGLTERYADSIHLMCRTLGLPEPSMGAPAENAVDDSGISASFNERALGNNLADLRVVEHVRNVMWPRLEERGANAPTVPKIGALRWRARRQAGRLLAGVTRVAVEPWVHRSSGVVAPAQNLP